MEAKDFFEILAPTYQTAWRHIVEECNFHIRRREKTDLG
jgi:hypothetical protein